MEPAASAAAWIIDDVDTTQRLRAWTHGRQRLGDQAVTPLEAIASVVAVYSAHPTAPLALSARCRTMNAAAFRELDLRRLALRVPGMRGSQFLAARDHAARVFGAFRMTPSVLAARLRRCDLTPDQYADMADRILASATQPRLPKEFHAVTGRSGLELSVVLNTLRVQGRMLCVAGGSLRTSNLRYVATDSWAPGALQVADRDRAVAEVAGDYLRGYGPARVADFAWWAGLPKGLAQSALAMHTTIDVEDGLLLHKDDEGPFSTVTPLRGTVDLLPKWDAYTMGFAPDGRARLVHPDNQPNIYVTKGRVAPGQPNIGLPGDGFPVVLVDGEAVGTWNVTVAGASVALFDTAGPVTRRRLEERLDGVRALLSEPA